MSKMSSIINREKHTMDATGKSLGRLASDIAMILMGKNKPTYEPSRDCGDVVIVQNVQYIKLTGNKEEKKVYYRNTGYPGGIRTTHMKDLKKDAPATLLRQTVQGMLPKNSLQKAMLKRLIIE